jgi:ABC-type nitrate/sulfonate/bicarbonate transport system substrate-binding protein
MWTMEIRREQTTTGGTGTIALKLPMLRPLIVAFGLFALANYPAAALDQVSLQLKWQHQFQFAGYYAALEKGFYRDAGLDVEIREGGPDVDANKVVTAGRADFGVRTSSVLLDRANGRNLVVLGVIFQHIGAAPSWDSVSVRTQGLTPDGRAGER